MRTGGGADGEIRAAVEVYCLSHKAINFMHYPLQNPIPPLNNVCGP